MSSTNLLKLIEYRKILYITDLSESGRQAFPHAAAIARCNNSQLTVFHVVETRDLQSLEGYVSDELWNDLTHRSLEDARQILLSRRRDNVAIENIEQFCKDCMAKETDQPVLNYTVKVEVGEPLNEILNEAHSGEYDLMVVSKHGNRASVKDAVIGDTTRRIIRRSKIPVLLVPLAGG